MPCLIRKKQIQGLPGGKVAKTLLPMQEAHILFLVRELDPT